MYTNSIPADVALSNINKHIDFFMSQAWSWASLSKDPSTKVGAIVVQGDIAVVQGWNGFARRIKDDPNLLNDRTQKYPRIVHAEQNCICNAAKAGIKLEGGIIFCTHHPCNVCANFIIQSGIAAVVFDVTTFTEEFKTRMNISIAEDTLYEAKIPVIGVDYDPNSVRLV